ncbi:MAG: transposase, partial [Candidatus Magasanikbacteria bacterium]|nr:transposase [Candidatus Magasanikbacteria bacterium]
SVGVPLVGTQTVGNENNVFSGKGQAQGTAPTVDQTVSNQIMNNQIVDEKIVDKKTIGDIVGALKSITTNKCIDGVKNNNWPRFEGKLWQRNYYEHIIRNEKSLDQIRDYIINNPRNWKTDEMFSL